jgi:hypothetical protein
MESEMADPNPINAPDSAPAPIPAPATNEPPGRAWGTPLQLTAATIAVITAAPVGAFTGLLTLGAIGINTIQSERAASQNREPTSAPEVDYSTDLMGNISSGGCVEVRSRLPGQLIAGEIRVGNTMQLGDAKTLEAGIGIVSYSGRKRAPGLRITTEDGVTLICSHTAPIPTKDDGLILAPALLGKMVATRLDTDGAVSARWRKVTAIDSVGEIEVQHITVGDQCFWAGEKANAYILHHNIKAFDGGSTADWWWW